MAVLTPKEREEQFRAIRKEAGLKIDPETAEVFWTYVRTMDPYGIDPELPEELQQVGRGYFARAPGGDIWVEFSDLPRSTSCALWRKHRNNLAFPAGIFDVEALDLQDNIAVGHKAAGDDVDID